MRLFKPSKLLWGLPLALLALAAGPAHAHGVQWGVSVGSPGVAVGVGSGPVYVAPPPVYVPPRRVMHVQPDPVYVVPARRPGGTGGRFHYIQSQKFDRKTGKPPATHFNAA